MDTTPSDSPTTSESSESLEIENKEDATTSNSYKVMDGNDSSTSSSGKSSVSSSVDKMTWQQFQTANKDEPLADVSVAREKYKERLFDGGGGGFGRGDEHGGECGGGESGGEDGGEGDGRDATDA